MRSRFLLTVGSFLLSFGFSFAALAQAPASADASTQSSDQTTAVISAPDDIPVGRTVILDASASHVTGERTQYIWSIDETKQVIGRNVEAIYTPEKSGTLTFRLTVKSIDLSGKSEQAEAAHQVVVFKRKIVLIADESVPLGTLTEQMNAGMNAGVYLKLLRPAASTPTLGLEDALFALLSQDKQTLANAESVVVWTNGIAGVQALIRYIGADPDRQVTIHNQSIILLTNRSIATLARTTYGAYSLLKPEQIIITRPEALSVLITASLSTDFRSLLRQATIDAQFINETTLRIRPWDVISILVNYLLSHGVAGQTVILLLMLPIIATIFAFLKQVIGITSFGLYMPSIVALSFLSLGWWIGLLFLLFILITGSAVRSLMKRWRLLYIPKVAIVLAVVSFSLLILVAIGTWFGLSFSRDTIFILLILSTLTENFLNLKTEEGWTAALLGIGETVLGSLLCVFIVQWQWFQSIVLAYPELILLTIPVNVALGRWTGLRLMEFVRFREVFRHLQEEE